MPTHPLPSYPQFFRGSAGACLLISCVDRKAHLHNYGTLDPILGHIRSSDLDAPYGTLWAIEYEAPQSLHAVRLFLNLLSPLCRTGGALGHGTGPCELGSLLVTGASKRPIVEDFSENFVDVDMNARMKAVDEWMVRRENQSMYWEQPIDAFQASTRTLYRRVTQPEADA